MMFIMVNFESSKMMYSSMFPYFTPCPVDDTLLIYIFKTGYLLPHRDLRNTSSAQFRTPWAHKTNEKEWTNVFGSKPIDGTCHAIRGFFR